VTLALEEENLNPLSQDSRQGTVILLGAGASADAGYPTADELFTEFKSLLHEASEKERESAIRIRNGIDKLKGRKPKPDQVFITFPFEATQSLEDWFNPLWEQFKNLISFVPVLKVPHLNKDGRPHLRSAVFRGPGGIPTFPPYSLPLEGTSTASKKEPYLESFFAHYDEILRPSIVTALKDFKLTNETIDRFRDIRQIAIRVAYRTLSAYERKPASYLGPLFNVKGPLGKSAPIATMNFDVSIEQLARKKDLSLFDGFFSYDSKNILSPWVGDRFKNLSRLWEAVHSNLLWFKGFEELPSDTTIFLKLHGSLGWYILEEGSGDIGVREELRHNTQYDFLRLPYEYFWDNAWKAHIDDIAIGGPKDPTTQIRDEKVSRKAGALWLRPYMLYALSLKTHPDHLSLELFGTFNKLLKKSRNILVIGYSWSDPHINDLLFGAVAQGAAIINIGNDAKENNFLAIIMHRLPTTFPAASKRVFSFGGGAKKVFNNLKIDLPKGHINNFDIIEALNTRIPEELSVSNQFA